MQDISIQNIFDCLWHLTSGCFFQNTQKAEFILISILRIDCAHHTLHEFVRTCSRCDHTFLIVATVLLITAAYIRRYTCMRVHNISCLIVYFFNILCALFFCCVPCCEISKTLLHLFCDRIFSGGF